MHLGWTKSTTVMAVAVASLLAPVATARAADGIVATRVNGHVVYINNDEANHTSAASEMVRPARTLQYWSNTEQRWKPVPHPTRAAMTAARSAAQEVASFVGSKPASANNAKPLTDPNFRDLARGRDVTSAEVDKAINQAAARHQVDPNLVRAVIKVESNFNPRAVSNKGAMGLMQLMPATARSLNVTNPFDPAQNVDAGVRHLKSLLNNFGGNIPLSLAAYNAGERAVLKHNAVPEFAETKSYVRQITNIYTGGAPLSQMRSVSRGTPMKMYRAADGSLRLTNDE